MNVICTEPIDQTKKSNQCKEGEILKARHDALRAADKDRIMKRKIMMAEVLLRLQYNLLNVVPLD